MDSSFPSTMTDVIDPYSRNLGRGQACSACRRRKLRCGGEKPSCNRCVEARTRKLEAMRRKGKSEEEIQAIRFPPCYGEGEDADRNGTEASGSNHASTSAQGPDAIVSASTVSTDRSSIDPLTPEDRRPAKSRKLNDAESIRHRLEAKQSNETPPATQNDLFFAEILSSHLPLDASSRAPSNDPFAQAGPHATTDIDVNSVMAHTTNGKNGHGLLGHPTTSHAYWLGDTEIAVPSNPLLARLVDIFFEEHWTAYIFHPQRLRERLALDPQNSNYPHASTLHMIVAMAYAARPDIDEEVSGEKPTHRTGAHYRHVVAAQHSMDYTVHCDCRVNAFDLVRTCILLVSKLYGQGDQLESFLAGAQAARMSISLNMNRDVPSRAEQQLQPLHFLLMQPRITDASVIRPEPQDEIEAEEVRRTMNLMFVTDRTTIAATLWPGALTEEDYTAEFPRATLEEFLSTTTENVDMQPWTQRRTGLTLQSSDFFSRRAVDAEQFLVKSSILLGRCAHYVSRLSRTATIDQIVSATRFQQLESWITSMHLESYEMASLAAKTPPGGGSTSSSNGSGTNAALWAPRKSAGSLATYLLNSGRSDPLRKGYLITGSIVPYACTLTLHEPLAGLSAESEARCQAATRGAIGILRLYAVHAEEEMQRLDVLMTIVVMIVGRSLIRQFESLYSKFLAQEMAQGNGSGDASTGGAGGSESVWNTEEFTESVALLQADLEVVLLTLKRFGEKWLVALKMHDSLLKLLQFNPEHRLRGLFCVE